MKNKGPDTPSFRPLPRVIVLSAILLLFAINPTQTSNSPSLSSSEQSVGPGELSTPYYEEPASSRNRGIPPAYRPMKHIERRLSEFLREHPALFHLEKIGSTTGQDHDIWGARISDNASEREDEPRILFTGVHHAREPIGANICMAIMEALLQGYGKDREITRWVDSSEIWFIPVVNPDGYQYVLDNNLEFPWWRKNLRDNDGDGRFNPLYDGVDLNRNYDFNWQQGGDGQPGSWFFRGASPFSENETRAVMRLAERENFSIGISYHSYGESVLFPWGNFDRPPDLDLIVDIAGKLASRLRRQTGGGTYSVLPLNGRVGQSSIWMYGHLKVIDYIVEVGTEYFPAQERVPGILRDHVKGAFYLFARLLQSGLRGHVFDERTHSPLLADIKVRRFVSEHISPRRTDPNWGSFHRLLNPGTYTVTIESKGYRSKTLHNVRVRTGKARTLEVGLRKIRDYTNGH